MRGLSQRRGTVPIITILRGEMVGTDFGAQHDQKPLRGASPALNSIRIAFLAYILQARRPPSLWPMLFSKDGLHLPLNRQSKRTLVRLVEAIHCARTELA
jgi:hypothetical protein